MVAAVVLVAALALAVVLGRSDGGSSGGAPVSAAAPASGFAGAGLPAGLPAHDFALREVLSGRPVTLHSFSGQVVVLAFPYTDCGATCTLLAQQVRGALDELPRAVPVLFVSADPGADSPAKVRRFLAQVSLGGRVHYLTGSPAALSAAWHAYGVAPASAGHTAYASRAAVFLLDAGGSERVVYGLEQLTPEGLAHDICKLDHDCP